VKVHFLSVSAATVITVGALVAHQGFGNPQARERGSQNPVREGDAGRGARGGGGLANKVPELPAGAFTASSTVAHTVLQHEWVDVPLSGARLHTWVEYPAGAAKAPVVVVMSHEAGLDDWMRAIADQLASQGFIGVAPDILSGRGPSGGNIESFKFSADVIAATAKVPQKEVMRRYKAAREYALKLPRANGKSASLGIGMGGADSFYFAAETPDLDAAVVFYGISPEDAVLAKIKAPVAGFYGGDDPRVMPTVTRAEATMKRLGKTYGVHVYPGATQAFLRSQAEGLNGAATAGSWPAAIEFLQQYLK
jgi:carboxymethylenebutenolidase